MPYTNPQPLDLGFPLRGVDRSLPSRRQPPMTTYELLNVRAFPPSSDRLGGGSREGYSKLYETIGGAEGDRRIQGIDVLTEATTITDPSQFASVALAEDWSTQSVGDPSDLGDDWHPIRIGSVGDPINHLGTSINTGGIFLDSRSPGGTATIELVLSAYLVDTAVGVTAVITGDRTAATTNEGYAAAGQPSNVGPVLSVSNTGTVGIFACFFATGSDTVQAKIYEFSTTSLVEKATSGDLVLDGTSTSSDYTITLTNDGGAVEATFAATGVLTAGANINETLNYTSTQTGKRGGIAVKPMTGTIVADARTVKSVSLTQLHPPSDTVFSSIDPSQPNPHDANDFWLPAGWVGVERSTAGALTVTSGGPTSSTDPNWLAIKDSTNTLSVTNPQSGSSSFPDNNNFALYQDITNGYGLKLRADLANLSDDDDIGSPVFRASVDGRNGLLIRFNIAANATTNMVLFTGFHAISLVDNVATYLGSGSFNNLFMHGDGSFRITDDGATILAYTNGYIMDTIDPTALANWTAGIGSSLSAYIGVGVTGGIAASGTSFRESFMGRADVVQGEEAPTINVSNVKNKMAVYSATKVQMGDTNTLTLVNVSGPVMSNPLPSSASFNRKFYAVDGNDEIIIDPATNVATDWASAVTDGTLPTGIRLNAFFRGSAYLAATDSDPSIWYKSRTLDPLDWDYGADPQVSSAVAGNNGSVGQPGDAITALIPFSDDYLLFGMARSLGVLEGDPGYGGQFQIASNEAGVVGPRAWAFDDRGNLFFVGAGGLYMMIKGGFMPEPVGPRKLRRALEELDIDSNLIQVGYRASDRTIRIYVTPSSGETAGIHIVYDTRTEGFFLDQLPLGFGPWAIEQTNGVLDIDRNLVIGCDDGYIRRPDDSAFSDDGTAIASHVEIALPEAAMGTVETICQEIQFGLGEGGDTITWRWFTGSSPEEVRLLTVGSESASGTITGTGYQPPIGLRETGASHKIRLEASSASAAWSLERIVAQMGVTSNRRR